MSTGWPAVGPETALRSAIHGWPMCDEGDGWTHEILFDSPCDTCINRYAPATNPSGCAGIKALVHDRPAYHPITRGYQLGKYSPAIALSYFRHYQELLQWLHFVLVQMPAKESPYWGENTRLFANQWNFWATAVSGETVTIQNVKSGYANPLNITYSTATTPYGASGCLQPGDMLAAHTGWNAPMGLIRKIAFGSSSTTIWTTKEFGSACSPPCLVAAWGERGHPPSWDYPVPCGAPNVEGETMCAFCRVDHSGSIHTLRNALAPSSPAYQAVGEFDGQSWFCSQWANGADYANFAPGECAHEACPNYEAGVPWPPIPAAAWTKLWLARNIYQRNVGGVLVWGRVEHPSLSFLAGCETYGSQGLKSCPLILWYGRALLGKIDASKDVIQGVMGEDAANRILATSTNRQSFVGGIAGTGTIADAGSDHKIVALATPNKRLANIALNSHSVLPGTPGEYATQTLRKRQRTFPNLDRTELNPVQHNWGTTEFHDPGKWIVGVQSGLTITLTHERNFPEKSIGAYARTIDNASLDNNQLKIEFRPEPVTVGYIHSVSKEDVLVYVLAGGGIVDPPQWKRCVNNYTSATRAKFGGMYDKAQQGDSLTFDINPEYRFTVTRAEAHGGAKYTGGNIAGIDPATEPKGDTGEYCIGVPDYWDSAGDDGRLKMDTLWIDWAGDLGQAVIGLPNSGDTVTIEGAPIMAPHKAWNGSAWVDSGYQNYPIVKVWAVDSIEDPVVLQEGSDYLVDRATAKIEVLKTVTDTWPETGVCIIVDGYLFDRTNCMQAELLYETAAAFRNLDGIKDGPGFLGCALQAKDTLTGNPTALQLVTRTSVFCPEREDGHRIWPFYHSPTAYLGTEGTAPSSEFQECAQCAADYPGSYDGKHCTQTAASRWSPGSVPALDWVIVAASSPYTAGASVSLSWNDPTGLGFAFYSDLYMVELTSSTVLACLRGDQIKKAWADIQLFGGTTYTRRIYKPKGVMNPTIDQLDSTEGTAHIGISALLVRQVGDGWRVVRAGGIASGAGHLVADEEWHTVDITSAARMLADGQFRQGDRLFWIVAGKNPVDAGDSFDGLWKSYVNTHIEEYPADYGAEGEWLDALIDLSVDRTVYTGLAIDNLRIQLDWDVIDATDMAPPFYENWPSPQYAP